MDTQLIKARLRNLSFFQKMDDIFLDTVLQSLVPLSFGPDTYVVRRGDLGDALFIIAQGEVEVLRDDEKTAIITLSPGDIFGEVSIVFSEPRSASIRTRTDCQLFRLGKASFDEIVARFPAMGQEIKKLASIRRAISRLRQQEYSPEDVQQLKRRMAVSKLRQVPLFEGEEDSFFENLAPHLVSLVVPSKKMVIQKGQRDASLYILARGCVEVLDDSETEVVDVMNEGDVFGEIALIFNEPRTATIRTQSLCELYQLDKPAFEEVIQTYPAVLEEIRQLAQDRNRLVHQRRRRDTQSTVSDTDLAKGIFAQTALAYSAQEQHQILCAACQNKNCFELEMTSDSSLLQNPNSRPKLVEALETLGSIVKTEPSLEKWLSWEQSPQLTVALLTVLSKEQLLEDMGRFECLQLHDCRDVLTQTQLAQLRVDEWLFHPASQALRRQWRVKARLQRHFLFKSCPEEKIGILARHMKSIELEAGAYFCRWGEPRARNYLWLLGEGSAEVLDAETGRPVYAIGTGEVFGDSGLCLGQAQCMEIRARTHCEAYQLSRLDFEQWLRDMPELRQTLLTLEDLGSQHEAFLAQPALDGLEPLKAIYALHQLQSLLSFPPDAPQFFEKLIESVEVLRFQRGAWVIHPGTQTDLWVLLQGTASILEQDGTTVFASLAEGDRFGNLHLLKEAPAYFGVQTSQFCVAYRLASPAAHKLLNSYRVG